MSAVKRGQTITENDLPIFFDKQGMMSDAYSIVYDYYDCTEGTPLLIGMLGRIPVKFSVGKYYPALTIDDDEPLGKHIIRWRYKESANDTEKVIDREFDVIPSQAAVGQQYPDRVKQLIYELRKKLRDIDPGRDYKFQPPTSGGGSGNTGCGGYTNGGDSISSFTRCRGYRWPDEQLANHLSQAVNFLNLYAPISCFDLCNLPCILENLVLQQAMVFSLQDMASLWINEEFSYSLNGINLDIQRSDKYLNMANQLQETVTATLERSKGPLMRSIKGLAQSPYLFSRGAALGPLTSGINMRRFVR